MDKEAIEAMVQKIISVQAEWTLLAPYLTQPHRSRAVHCAKLCEEVLEDLKQWRDKE